MNIMKQLSWRQEALIFVAAMVGGSTRYGVDQLAGTAGLDFGTLLVNVCGCFLLAALPGVAVWLHWRGEWQLAAGTGFVGAFTTFSTLMLDVVRQLATGWTGGAVILALNLGLGLIAVLAGMRWSQHLSGAVRND